MALTPSFPGVTGLTTTTDARKAFAGLVAKSSAGVPRSGVFPRHTAALVAARSDMNVDIGIFEAAAVQFGGAIFFSNDATAQLPSALVSPGAGTNFYVVYAKQNESTAPGTDANNNRIFGAALSTTSFAAARALLPTGAVELATVQMPTGKTATNQSGVTITATHQYTATEGGTVLLRNQTEEDAWTPHDGAIADRIDLGQLRQRAGGVWRPIPYAEEVGSVVCPNTGGTVTGSHGYSDLIDVTFTAGRFTVAPRVFLATTGPADQVTWGGMAEQITTSGCKVRGGRVGAAPNNLFTVHWRAVQMSVGSANG